MPQIGDKFYMNARGKKATGVYMEDGFLVLEGAEVSEHTAAYLAKSLVELREKYITDGTINNGILSRDVMFKSPSTAATFLLGANVSGPQTWKDARGISLLKIEKVEKGIIPDPAREYRSFYKVVGGNEGRKCHYPTRLDTYGCGCGHDCSYCYAKAMLSFRDSWDPLNPKLADIKRIDTKLKQIEPGTIVRLGGMTDCFQPCELKYGITKQTIELLNKYGIGYLIVTKSHLIADDEYIKILDKRLAHIQITVTTTDDAKSLEYEKASVPSKRIEAIEKLYKKGFDVFFRLSPYIDGYIDFDVLNNVQCEKVLVEFLRVNGDIKNWFDIDYSDYTLSQDGFFHLPLDKKLEMLGKIKNKTVTVCDDYDDHYNYFRDNYNPNPKDCCNLTLD